MAEGVVSTAKRNRMIAVAAGAITVVAIVLAFASGYLGLPWQWLRPAAELLLLGELVGLIVLERRQLFEPVHDKTATMEAVLQNVVAAQLTEISSAITTLSERAHSSGEVTVCSSPPEVHRALTLICRES